MSIFKKKLLISMCSSFLLLFLCYAVYPRSALTVSSTASFDYTLILDAGHGGEDGGALSRSGVRESDLNLSIAQRTENLAALLGIKTVMTRDADISVHDKDCTSISEKKKSDLRNRVNLANMTPNAMILSIHQNHFAEEKYKGAQVFYANIEGSKFWAETLQNHLRVLDSKNHRQCKQSQQIYLMEHIQCPAVLVECGFLSNPVEAQLLQEQDYQKKLAMVLLQAVATKGKGVTEEHEV